MIEGDTADTAEFLRELYSDDDFRDCILVCEPDKKEIHAHRHVLGARSSVFKRAFTAEFRETRERKMEVYFPFDVVNESVKVFYLGSQADTPKSRDLFFGMLEFAEFFDAKCLFLHVDNCMKNAMKSVKGGLKLLKNIPKIAVEKDMLCGTREKCYSLLADRFAYICEVHTLRDIFLSLDYPTIAPLLRHPDLSVDETPFLLLLNKWCARQGKDMYSSDFYVRKIFNHVRLGLMEDVEARTHAQDHPYIPQQALYNRHMTEQHITPRPHTPAIYRFTDRNRIEIAIRRPEGFWLEESHKGHEAADTSDLFVALTDTMSMFIQVFPGGDEEDIATAQAEGADRMVCVFVGVRPTDRSKSWEGKANGITMKTTTSVFETDTLVWVTQGEVTNTHTQQASMWGGEVLEVGSAFDDNGEVCVAVEWEVVGVE
eukprot:GDKI01020292.1.p1 GENE.GDKI01020292.1~~GDKI01020292.1.p1  ORF type:complete len:428 (-),score=82.48 GDKI01020292.1:429-1712(-)